jgi:hypothetical protein
MRYKHDQAASQAEEVIEKTKTMDAENENENEKGGETTTNQALSRRGAGELNSYKGTHNLAHDKITSE